MVSCPNITCKYFGTNVILAMISKQPQNTFPMNSQPESDSISNLFLKPWRFSNNISSLVRPRCLLKYGFLANYMGAVYQGGYMSQLFLIQVQQGFIFCHLSRLMTISSNSLLIQFRVKLSFYWLAQSLIQVHIFGCVQYNIPYVEFSQCFIALS